MSDLLGPALAYAQRGWPVFMLGRTKRPVANCPNCPTGKPGHDPAACRCLTCHGFYAATCDPDRITAMIRAVPRGVLATRTGTASGLAVVDIDPRNGGAIDPDLMPRTACVRTGGGGWHLYYRHPGGPLSGKLADHPGVDIKGDGGYVVAPPSVHPDTRRLYEWAGAAVVNEMTPALITACRPSAPTRPTPHQRTPRDHTIANSGAGVISSPAALLAAHLAAIDRAPEGRRRTTLYGAARGVARMVAAHALTATAAWDALVDAGRAAGQAPRDIRNAIAGGFRDEGVPL